MHTHSHCLVNCFFSPCPILLREVVWETATKSPRARPPVFAFVGRMETIAGSALAHQYIRKSVSLE